MEHVQNSVEGAVNSNANAGDPLSVFFLIQLSQTIKKCKNNCKEIWKPKEEQKEKYCAL